MVARALNPRSQQPLKLYAEPSPHAQTYATIPADHAPLPVTSRKGGFYGVVINGHLAWVDGMDVKLSQPSQVVCGGANSSTSGAGTLGAKTDRCGTYDGVRAAGSLK
jgi:hypothetical protein